MYDEFDVMSMPNVTAVKRTAELKSALCSFLAQCGASCYEDKTNADILRCYSRLQNGMCVEQEIRVGDSDYVCYTNLSNDLKSVSPEETSALVFAINRVNVQLKYGNFEFNEGKGVLRFRSFYEPGREIGPEDLDRLVGEPLWAIETYIGQLLYADY